MPASTIKNIVFDLGNVLIRWDPRLLYRKLFNGDEKAMDRFLAEVCTPEWNDSLDADKTFADGTAELIARFPAQEAFIRAYDDRWEEMLGGPFTENVALLEELSGKGWPLYALSNWSKDKFPIARARYGFLKLFRGMVVSGEVGVRKPDPAIFKILLDRYSLDPSETAFIDDTAKHCETARSLGLVAIQHVNPAQLRVDLSKMGIPVESR